MSRPRYARVAVLDAGASNIFSVLNALERTGLFASAVHDPKGLAGADAIVFPGVANFGTICAALDARGLRDPLLARLRAGVPFLGICAGLQVLFDESEEAPGIRGLAVLRGSVRRLRSPKVPHIGWTRCRPLNAGAIVEPGWAYFAHSYAPPEAAGCCVATASYDEHFAAACVTDNVAGVQFHPEKSGAYGAAFLARWAESWHAL